jgi:membrane peptidoglycan carboxypeptidase
MINQPGFFDPTPHTPGYAPLLARWHYVLTNMVRDGAISQRQADAQVFPALVPGPAANGWTGFRGYIMQAVQNELSTIYHIGPTQADSRGLKIVTTFNESMMRALYRSVAENERQMRANGTPLPSFAHVGAVLEKPGTGAILAMYGGPSYTAKNCARLKCQYNMAMESRNQVGSSFKPYVLATAVHENMNVQNSVLNGVEPMCVPPDTMPMTMSAQSTTCQPGWFPVNIAGENVGPISVSKAAALSSDPAFEDLIHRTGTQNTISMAKAFGVDTVTSGLKAKSGEVGIALGTASLTVEEQATTFATLAADGLYSTPHVIASITTGGGTAIPLRIMHRQVLSPAQAADVDYALSFDTVGGGTAFPNGVLTPTRPTIGKTGTTDQAQSAFFIGAIPQYSLAVGMFTNSQNEIAGGQTLNQLASVNGQGGGYGGNWPTVIWRTYMNNEFASLPVRLFPAPNFTGFAKWVQVRVRHHPHKPKPGPAPSPSCGPLRGQGHGRGEPCPGPSPSCMLSPAQACPTPTPTPTTTPSPTPTSTPTPTPSCTPLPGGICPTQPPPGGAGQQQAVMAAQAADDHLAARMVRRPRGG